MILGLIPLEKILNCRIQEKVIYASLSVDEKEKALAFRHISGAETEIRQWLDSPTPREVSTLQEVKQWEHVREGR